MAAILQHKHYRPGDLVFRKGDPMAKLFQQALQSMIEDGSYRKIMADWQITELSLQKALFNGE